MISGKNGGPGYRSETRGRSLSPRGRSMTRSRSRDRSESPGAGARSTKARLFLICQCGRSQIENHNYIIFNVRRLTDYFCA